MAALIQWRPLSIHFDHVSTLSGMPPTPTKAIGHPTTHFVKRHSFFVIVLARFKPCYPLCLAGHCSEESVRTKRVDENGFSEGVVDMVHLAQKICEATLTITDP